MELNSNSLNMKLSLKKCLSVQAGLVQLSDSKMLDLKNSFAVAKNMRELEPIIETFDKVRSDFMDKLKEKADEEGNVPVEEVNEVNTAIQDLLKEEHVVKLSKLNLSNMSSIDVPAKVISQVLDIAEYDI